MRARKMVTSGLFVVIASIGSGQTSDAQQPVISSEVVIVVGPRTLVSADHPDVHHAEPHLAIDPTDARHLVAVVAVLPDSSAHRIDAFLSVDGGETWTRRPLPGLADTESLDPWVAFGPDGTPVVTVLIDDHGMANPDGFSPAGIAVFRSRDGGHEWRGPWMAPYGLGASYDQQKIGIDQSDGPFRGRMYIAASHWGPRTRPGNRPTGSVGVISSHNARTFHGPVEIAPNNVNKASVQPVVLSDGTLVLLYREWGFIPDYERTDLLWAVHSTDGGATYSAPFLVSAWTSLGFVDATASHRRGEGDRVFAVWLEDVDRGEARASAADYPREAPRRLLVAYSDERGMAWSTPVPLTTSDEGSELVMSRVATDGQGNVVVAWVEDRQTATGRCHRWLVSASTDGGDSFSDATSIGEPACYDLPGEAVMMNMVHEFQPIMPRFGRGGDYFGLVGLPDGGFRILWSAAEDGVLRLWTAPISITG